MRPTTSMPGAQTCRRETTDADPSPRGASKPITEPAKAWRMVAFVHGPACRWEEPQPRPAARPATMRASPARTQLQERGSRARMPTRSPTGPRRSTTRSLACEEMRRERPRHQAVGGARAEVARSSVALDGDFDRAREHYRRARAMLTTWALRPSRLDVAHARADRVARRGSPGGRADLRHRLRTTAGDGRGLLTAKHCGNVGPALQAQGRVDEAEAFAREAEKLAADDDIELRRSYRSVLGRSSSERGAFDEAFDWRPRRWSFFLEQRRR